MKKWKLLIYDGPKAQYSPPRVKWYASYKSAVRAAKKFRARHIVAMVEHADSSRANPGRARHVRGSTGWLQAKAVRIVKQHGRTVVQIRRAAKRRSR